MCKWLPLILYEHRVQCFTPTLVRSNTDTATERPETSAQEQPDSSNMGSAASRGQQKGPERRNQTLLLKKLPCLAVLVKQDHTHAEQVQE